MQLMHGLAAFHEFLNENVLFCQDCTDNLNFISTIVVASKEKHVNMHVTLQVRFAWPIRAEWDLPKDPCAFRTASNKINK